jgi:hypothetical protein
VRVAHYATLSLSLTLSHHAHTLGSTSPLLLAAGLVPCPPCQYMSLYVNVLHAVFMDAPNYVADFKGADPVWNVTGSGGTNAKCLAAYPATEAWKCLLAPFILPHIQADIYVMNSAYDAWQIGNNKPGCVSTAAKPCDDSGVQAYGKALKARVRAGLAAKKTGAGGAFIGQNQNDLFIFFCKKN